MNAPLPTKQAISLEPVSDPDKHQPTSKTTDRKQNFPRLRRSKHYSGAGEKTKNKKGDTNES